jgi:hypothetical protein
MVDVNLQQACKQFHRVEHRKGQGDCSAHAGEGQILPQQVWNQRWLAALYLAMTPCTKGRQGRGGEAQQYDAFGIFDLGDVGAQYPGMRRRRSQRRTRCQGDK